MGDILGLDPARIARLRDPARLRDVTSHPLYTYHSLVTAVR